MFFGLLHFGSRVWNEPFLKTWYLDSIWKNIFFRFFLDYYISAQEYEMSLFLKTWYLDSIWKNNFSIYYSDYNISAQEYEIITTLRIQLLNISGYYISA